MKRMTTTVIDSLAKYIIGSMSVQEREYLIDRVLAFTDDSMEPYTISEVRERFALAREQFNGGKFKSHEQVMQPRNTASI